MSERIADTTIAHQIELAIRRLDSLSTLPSVAARFLSQLLQFRLTPSSLADIIESEPALAVRILSLVDQQGTGFGEGEFSIRQALEKLSLRAIRDAVLSVKVYRPCDQDDSRSVLRGQLVLHSLAVGCCARAIAEAISGPMDSQMAYLAGLLHDIGKLALDETMPKSFARILEQAKSKQSSIYILEQRHLGTDHTLLGKRLAEKWHFPGQIGLGIWLHHSDASTILEAMPEAKIAGVVQLADLIVRQEEIGQSGSYDAPGSTGRLAESLGINGGQLEQIRAGLSEQVAGRYELLGLDLERPQEAYFDNLAAAASQLAQENTKLSVQYNQLQTASSHLDFTKEFLSGVNIDSPPAEIAEDFAVRWQKFFQTGPVCLYLAPSSDELMIEAFVAEKQSQIKTMLLNVPVEAKAIPEQISKGFSILDADGYADWLFEQLEVNFDRSRTKMLPLLSGEKAVGAIVFELGYPADNKQLEEKLRFFAHLAGAVLGMALARRTQQRYAERFVQLLTGPIGKELPALEERSADKIAEKLSAEQSLLAVAEMAAGAAHELNNPLSVVSGRAQLLSDAEDDPEKKRMLKQIQDNAKELSNIIDDLMGFAQPEPPRFAETNIRQMLDEAVQLTVQKTKLEEPDIQFDIAEDSENVLVDSAQIASAIANILSNSLESYSKGSGPVKVAARANESGDFVKLQVADSGCGMDEETLKKATQPFFCSKPAGRKRGMGLAHALRLIQLNKGSLDIESRPGEGTTVTILLPTK